MSPLSSNNGWTDRNVDCCVNTVDEKNTTASNSVNFGPVAPQILWLICTSVSQNTLCAGFKGHSLITINDKLAGQVRSSKISKKCTVAFAHAGRATGWADFLVVTHAGIAACVDRAFSRVCFSVCLFVRALTGKRLGLSTPTSYT